ncbi:MAG: cob(I)yrinic acid a,c-diamide adenosyltransferase [Thaumarchaeota archaeon]|nr:cob(I)yrinic acid a,c-diamide adenosyltransferase [Nitrososphaerota archaeon]
MYTKRGDGGETSLFGAKRVPKDFPLVEAYGTIDELNSLLGLVIAKSRDRSIASSLREVQSTLFIAGADAAREFRPDSHPRIARADTEKLEESTDSLLDRLPKLRNFIVPGGSEAGALLQLARAVCRRAERRLVAASKVEAINPELVPFFNRLSSYLFNLSRLANKKAGRRETIWKG